MSGCVSTSQSLLVELWMLGLFGVNSSLLLVVAIRIQEFGDVEALVGLGPCSSPVRVVH